VLTGQILLQLLIILVFIQIIGALVKRTGFQLVIGEILAGLALGPSLLGHFFPGVQLYIFPPQALPTLQVFGDIGLAFYMFSLGARLNIHGMAVQRKSAIVVSVSGILLPFILGAVLGYYLYPMLAGTKATLLSLMLFMGTAMSITAFPVLARLLAEKEMLGTKLGILALTSASIDDVIAWCLLTLIIATVHSNGVGSTLITVGLTILFIIIMVVVVRPLLRYAMQHISKEPWRLGLSVGVLLLSAYITNALGIHLIFGAFLAGIVMPRNAALSLQIKGLDGLNNLLFLPVFFVFSGLNTRIGLIQSPLLWLICLMVIVVACLGKIMGATLSARALGQKWKEALGLGVLMNTRGLVELIVINIGLQLGVLSPTLFAMLVIMAIVTTMLASPLLPLLGYPAKKSPKEAVENGYEQVTTPTL
jgi:Kef-type K+ transport system membrane component KefB